MNAHHCWIFYIVLMAGLYTTYGEVEFNLLMVSYSFTEEKNPWFSYCISSGCRKKLYYNFGPFNQQTKIDFPANQTLPNDYPNPNLMKIDQNAEQPFTMTMSIKNGGPRATLISQITSKELYEPANHGRPAINKENATWINKQFDTSASVTLSVSFQIWCSTNFYGPGCTVECIEKNNSEGHYSCDIESGTKICLPDWKGDECKIAKTFCEKTPDYCSNGGTCVSADESCQCTPQFTGNRCQFKNGCSSDPCLNNGNCTSSQTVEGEFNCTCLPDFSGSLCEISPTSTSIPSTSRVMTSLSTSHQMTSLSTTDQPKMTSSRKTSTTGYISSTHVPYSTTTQEFIIPDHPHLILGKSPLTADELKLVEKILMEILNEYFKGSNSLPKLTVQPEARMTIDGKSVTLLNLGVTMNDKELDNKELMKIIYSKQETWLHRTLPGGIYTGQLRDGQTDEDLLANRKRLLYGVVGGSVVLIVGALLLVFILMFKRRRNIIEKYRFLPKSSNGVTKVTPYNTSVQVESKNRKIFGLRSNTFLSRTEDIDGQNRNSESFV